MEATREQRKAAKRGPTEKDQPSDFNSEESASALPPNPLSILVTVAHIFSFLKPEDLERCSQVNRCWRAVAKPMIPLHYNVEIRAPQNGSRVTRRNRRRPIIILSKRAQDNTKSGKEFSLRFAAAKKILEQAFRTCNGKLVLSLKTNFHIDNQPKNVEKFLQKFLPLVQHMDWDVGSQSVDRHVFPRFLLKCPNLRTLNFSYLSLGETLGYMPDSRQNELLKLMKISWVGCKLTTETSAKLFIIAIALQEVQFLNLWLSNAVEAAVSGTGQVWKFKAVMTTHDQFPTLCLNVEVPE